MSTSQETELRREFDAARPPNDLTFSSESVLRQGGRTIRVRRIITAGSAVMAVGLIAVGSTLLTRPHNSAAPPPAGRTTSIGIVRAQTGHLWGGQSEVQFDRNGKVESNVLYSVVGRDGRRHELGVSSAGKPGQKPDATWRSGIVDGHPVTIGLLPGTNPDVTVTFADGVSYPLGSEELKGTGFTMFYVDYSALANNKEPARPSEIASIRWSGPTGVVDGIEGDHRLTGRILTLSENLSVHVVLRPADGGQITVFGRTVLRNGGFGYGLDLSAATTDPSQAAIATGRTPILKTAKGLRVGSAGAPLAAGILPPAASDIGVELTTNEAATGLAMSQRLPDGRVIFAVNADFGQSADASKDSIKAVTWTNADGTRGRKTVTQKQP